MASRAEQAETDPIVALVRRVQKLERELRELRATRRLESASIGAGGLRIKGGGQVLIEDEDGRPLIWLGKVPFGGDGTKPGLVAFRVSGEPAMSLYDGIYAIWDRQGNVVSSTDEASGQGIARPWLPVTWAASDYTTWPGTASGTFAAVCETAVSRQQPMMFARIKHTADASGTTGQVRLMCNGVQLGPTVSVGFSIDYTDIGPIALPPGSFGDILGLSVDARRVAGTGAVRAMVTASWTQQS